MEPPAGLPVIPPVTRCPGRGAMSGRPLDRFGAGRPVPAHRLSRLLRMGGLASGIAGGAVAGGIGGLAAGRRPRLDELILTPGNARRVAEELSRMRGAAMKVGQLISMDAGDVLPPEIAAILDRLRSEAEPMPPRQLRDVLDAAWGPGWIGRFARFDVRAHAAASIGQVHYARLKDGRELAVKVQYPGIRHSIDSDIRNIAALIRLSGAAPRGMDLAPLLEEARRQLHEEADYVREGAALDRFGAHVADLPGLTVPRRHPELCTPDVLAMDHARGMPVERLAGAEQGLRDEVAARLIDLVLHELFTFGEMQTDPNFANYLIAPETGQIVLLDFGAVRALDPARVAAFRALMEAGIARDREGARAAAIATGLLAETTPVPQQEQVLEMFDTAMAPIRAPGPFDFGTSDLLSRLREMGLRLGMERDFAHVPPGDTLLVQRKVAGTYLLAARLGARVDLSRIVAAHR